jgi:hypothetical protein
MAKQRMLRLLFFLILLATYLSLSACGNDDNNPTASRTLSNNTPMSNEASSLIWQKTFGGPRNEEARSIQQTSDGGYIVLGVQEQDTLDGYMDTYLLKIDEKGNELWSKTFGKSSENDIANSVQQTSEDGYIIAGHIEPYLEEDHGTFIIGSINDIYLTKTDSQGNELWTKTIGDLHVDESAFCVQLTSDGGYIIAGKIFNKSTSEDMYLIKTDKDGTVQWTNYFGNSNVDSAQSVIQSSDGGYVLAGYTLNSTDKKLDIYLVKADPEGNQQWIKTFGGSDTDIAESVRQTSDSGYIISGMTKSYGAGGLDAYVIKTDEKGNQQWQKTFGGPGEDAALSICQTSDGGYIISGSSGSSDSDFDVYVVKLDRRGDQEWSKTFGGPGNEVAIAMQQTSDGGYIIAGTTDSYGAGSSDIYLIKTDAQGNCESPVQP